MTPLGSGVKYGIGDGLVEKGIAVVENFIDSALVERLRAEVDRLAGAGEFSYARIGQGEAKQVCPNIRGDQIYWIDSKEPGEPQATYLASLEAVRYEINEATLLGLFEWEGHFALYGPGSFYRRHLDVFRHARERKVSTILYLNQDWTPACGGELRIYTEGTSLESYRDIEPRGGTLVCFLSDVFYHEVLPAHADRCSVTGWFRVRSA